MKYTHKFLLLLLAVCAINSVLAVTPSVTLTSYYSAANNKSGNTLRTALMGVIDDHTVIDYGDLKYLFKYSDTQDADGKTLIDIYTPCTFDVSGGVTWSGSCSGSTKVGCGLNREHTVPQSWFGESSPMVSDAFHIYPTDAASNNHRNNYYYGECNSGTSYTGSNCNEAGKLGASSFSGYSGTVYEPADEYKGDIARSYFYMATRYASTCSSWGNMFGSNNGLSNYTVNLMLKWHREDPVSEKELIRNEAIYGNSTYNKSSYKQQNRNPFIDFPCLVEYIWGDSVGKNVDFSKLISAYDVNYNSANKGCPCEAPTSDPLISLNPTSLTANTMEGGSPVTKTFNIVGSDLTGALTVTETSDVNNVFSCDVTSGSLTPTAGAVNATVSITYTNVSTPTNAAQTATYTISGGGATSKTITISGTCEAAPQSDGPQIVFGTPIRTASVSDGVIICKGTETLFLHIANIVTDVTLTSSDPTKFTINGESSIEISAMDLQNGLNITISKVAAGNATLTIAGGVINEVVSVVCQ